MSKRDELLLLQDIFIAGNKVLQFTEGMFKFNIYSLLTVATLLHINEYRY